MKNLRQVLQTGGCVVGSWINTGSPIVAELMAATGFDFLTVDAEHSAVDVPKAQVLFQAPGEDTIFIPGPSLDHSQELMRELDLEELIGSGEN